MRARRRACFILEPRRRLVSPPGRAARPHSGNSRPPAVVRRGREISKPGYVRKNGAPYSADATVTEYFDLHTMPNGDRWFTVTTKVEDPQYFSRPYITTSDFKKLPDGAGWRPAPCSAR